MGKAMFYHLTRDPVEVTAATLLTRALGAGWRVALRGGTGRGWNGWTRNCGWGEGQLPAAWAGGRAA